MHVTSTINFVLVLSKTKHHILKQCLYVSGHCISVISNVIKIMFFFSVVMMRLLVLLYACWMYLSKLVVAKVTGTVAI